MAYLKENDVRVAARTAQILLAEDSVKILRREAERAPPDATFDVFLCHSIRDADLVLGAKAILEKHALTVYVDWIVDPQMDRNQVSAATAEILRNRMNHSSGLFYLYSRNSTRSRWMPWELGYFDGCNGSVAVLPILPDSGMLDFTDEEYLGLYPKAEIAGTSVLVNRTKRDPVSAATDYKSFRTWTSAADKLRPRD